MPDEKVYAQSNQSTNQMHQTVRAFLASLLGFMPYYYINIKGVGVVGGWMGVGAA